MTLRCYRFTCNLNEAFEGVKESVRALEDYFPVDVSMFAKLLGGAMESNTPATPSPSISMMREL